VWKENTRSRPIQPSDLRRNGYFRVCKGWRAKVWRLALVVVSATASMRQCFFLTYILSLTLTSLSVAQVLQRRCDDREG
jgi:hypothetical protein